MNKLREVTRAYNFFAIVITALVSAYPLARLNPKFFPGTFSARLLAVVFVVLILALPLIWKLLHGKIKQDNNSLMGLTNGILAFALAFHFTKWGLLKIFHLHMTDSLGLMEMPMTMVSGEKQLSHFFGQSYAMVCVLGLAEIAGAVFILFRKTRLLGAVILLAIACNIVVIDVLYHVKDPLAEAIILLIGVLFLVYQDKQKVIAFFFTADAKLPSFDFGNPLFKNTIKLMAIVVPVLLLAQYFENEYQWKNAANNAVQRQYFFKSLLRPRRLSYFYE
jgi:hypothetical protein